MSEHRLNFVKSAQRVLEVLEYFDDERSSATVTDISRALSYPQSSTSVLLRCLRELGFLYYNRFHRTYRPTARAALLGCWAEGGVYRGGKMLDLADAICASTGQTVALSTGNVDYVIHHLHVVRGTAADALPVRSGDLEPFLHSPQGSLVLSSYPDAQARLALHRLNSDEEDPELRVSIADKLKEYQLLRQRGWAISVNEQNDGRGIVAVFLPRAKGGDRMVLSIIATADVMEARGEEFLQIILDERNRVFDHPSEEMVPARSPTSDVVSFSDARLARNASAGHRKAS